MEIQKDIPRYSVLQSPRPATARQSNERKVKPEGTGVGAPPQRPPLHLLKQWSRQMEEQMARRKKVHLIMKQQSGVVVAAEGSSKLTEEEEEEPPKENKPFSTGSARSYLTRRENLKTSLIDGARESASDRVWGSPLRQGNSRRVGSSTSTSPRASPRGKKVEKSHLDSPRVNNKSRGIDSSTTSGPHAKQQRSTLPTSTSSTSVVRSSSAMNNNTNSSQHINISSTIGSNNCRRNSSSLRNIQQSPSLGLAEGEAALQKLLRSLGGSSNKLLGGDEIVNVESAESFNQTLNDEKSTPTSKIEDHDTVVNSRHAPENAELSSSSKPPIQRSETAMSSNRCPSCGSVVRTRTTDSSRASGSGAEEKETQTPIPLPTASSLRSSALDHHRRVKIREPEEQCERRGREQEDEEEDEEDEEVPYAYDPAASSSEDLRLSDEFGDDQTPVDDSTEKEGGGKETRKTAAEHHSPVPRQIRLQVLQLEAQAMGRIVKEAAALDHQDRVLKQRKETQRTVKLIQDYSKLIEDENRAASRLEKFPMPKPPKRKALNPRASGSTGAVQRALRSERTVKSSEYFSGAEKRTKLDHELANRQRNNDPILSHQGTQERILCYDSAALQNKNVLRSVTEVSASPEELMKRVERRTRRNRLGDEIVDAEEEAEKRSGGGPSTGSSYNSLAEDLAFHSSRIMGMSSPSTVFFRHTKGLTVPPPASIYNNRGDTSDAGSTNTNKNLNLVNTTVTMGDQHILRLNLD